MQIYFICLSNFIWTQDLRPQHIYIYITSKYKNSNCFGVIDNQLFGDKHSHRQTDRQTLQLLDWIGLRGDWVKQINVMFLKRAFVVEISIPYPLKYIYFPLRSWHHKITRIGEQPYIEMLFGQFSYKNIIVKIVGKMQDQHFNEPLFSNPGDKINKRVKLWDNFVPYFQQESWPCPLDWRIIMHWNFVLAFFKQPWYMR